MNESTDSITLTDFLLARLAEDEKVARARAFTEDCIPKSGPPNPRPLAECEAKRRIVEQAESIIDDGTWWSREAGGRILRALATVYADHPHFREEWKS